MFHRTRRVPEPMEGEMSRIRLFILLSGCFLMASTALADDLGYVVCASHPESTQVFSKARQTPDSLGTVACGERFTILVYGFVFSRVQTRDGKVGYIYSNLITPDRGGAAPSQAAPRMPATPTTASPAATSAPAAVPAPALGNSAPKMDSPPVTTSPSPTRKAPTQPGQLFPTPPVPALTPADMSSASAQPAAASSPAPARSPAASTTAAPAVSQPTPTEPAPAATTEPAAASMTPAPAPVSNAQPAPPAPTQTAPGVSSSVPASAPAPSASAQPAAPASSKPSAPAQSSAASQPSFPTPPPPPPDPAPAPASASADPSPASAPVADPAPAAAPDPQPEAVQPAPVGSARVRSSWESPVPGVHQSLLLELYSGYGLARFNSGGTSTNLNGGMGSFGYNFKPWLQIGGDASYNVVAINGVRNVLYGNHFGARYFYHRFSRFTPFAEGLVGGSRVDTSGGGVQTSTNCISYKVGGGVDYRASRRWEIRLFNVDYYRTSFGTGTGYPGQSNYWASAGVVLRLFGSGASE